MIEMKIAGDETRDKLLAQMGVGEEDAQCFWAADREEPLGGAAFCVRGGQAVMLDLFTAPGLEGALGDGLIRGAWNYCSSHGVKIARFGERFPLEKLKKLEFFKDFGHEEIDIEKFFQTRKKCGQTR
ncbi:hypothetical protein [Zongyangia hominis]|uniref:Uncharacterized protein n=1 Tax=Zongyangia hominis TaxID=2763677 RepID=A0A926EFV0_9FIRM|nr:hypothetical protein [Zongyangia hominis]MBC8570927.1 hypothetical protein [Zongyangia hominis]